MSLSISLAIGVLLGNVFFHLLPESQNFNLVLLGLLIFFVLEKFLRWHHCHRPGHHHPLTTISLLGGLVHSFVDGALVTTGFGALLGVILHELPQKISYYSIFVHQKIPPTKAILLSLATSLPALLSFFIFISLITIHQSLITVLKPLTAGAFLYLAVADLIPELNHHTPSLPRSIVELCLVVVGIFLMALLRLLD